MRSKRLMETRLLIKDSVEWKAIAYIWNEDQKDAKLSKVGASIDLSITHAGKEHEFEYIIPNKNQCKSCHNFNKKITPIGFKLSNLSTDITRENGLVNQVDFLVSTNTINPKNSFE